MKNPRGTATWLSGLIFVFLAWPYFATAASLAPPVLPPTNSNNAPNPFSVREPNLQSSNLAAVQPGPDNDNCNQYISLTLNINPFANFSIARWFACQINTWSKNILIYVFDALDGIPI